MMVLTPNRTYRIGIDCPYGYYLVSSKSSSIDADFNMYETYPHPGIYKIFRCYFGCVEVKPPHKYVRIDDGKAVYYGDKPFDLYESISKAAIPEGKYSRKGVDVLRNPICNVKVHYRDTSSHLFFGEATAEVFDQIIFSINRTQYWGASFNVNSFKPYSLVSFCVSSGWLKKKYIFEQEHYRFSMSNDIGFATSGEKLRGLRVSRRAFYVMQFPEGVELSNAAITWIKPNAFTTPFYPTDRAPEELFHDKYLRLASILEKYKALGLDIEIEREIVGMQETPDFADICSEFLEKQYKQYERFKEKRRSRKKRYTFHVGTWYNKKYYCAVKIAEKAVDIQKDPDREVYYISFDGTQVDEISLMYFDLVSPFNEEKDYMVEIHEYLRKNDYYTHLEEAISAEIEKLKKQYGQTVKASGSVLERILKGVAKYKRRKLNALYAEMIAEQRVTTKWSNEYRLYSLIKRYFPDAIYQYRTTWLGSQSFDIYLPAHSTAIEYQGQQHFEPVEQFGGEESFASNVERDARKRKLSSEHGVTVLDWNYFVPVREETVYRFLSDNGLNPGDPADEHVTLPTESITMQLAPVQEKKARPPKESTPRQTSTVIRQFDTTGHFIAEFDTVKDASLNTGVSEKSISNAVYGTRKSGGGYIWKRYPRGSVVKDVEPVTQAENTGIGKPVAQYDTDGNFIAFFPSKSAASTAVGVSTRSISDALSGIQKTAGGFTWKYVD